MNRDQSINKLKSLIGHQRLSEACHFCVNLANQYPDDPQIWMMRLCLHHTLNDMDSLAECSRGFLESLNNKLITPEMLIACRTLIKIFSKKLRIQDLINIHEKLITIFPDEAEFHWNLSQVYLLNGDYERGWAEWEWRRKVSQKNKYNLDFCKDRSRWWDGSSLENKTLLVRTEQGHGDIIQFVRFLRKLRVANTKIMAAFRKFC
jgi:hypothetical protein